MIEQSIYLLAAIGIIGIGCQWLAWWLKLPAILFLLLAGIGAGPLTGILQPDRLFGDLLFPIVSLGVAVILFEGSLTLRLHEIKGLGSVVRNLVTVGALLTAAVIAVATRFLLNFPWELALLFGALVCVTGPTVIVPMLRTVRPKANLANILRWEGIIIDPLGALFAVLVYEFIVSGRGEEAHTLVVFGKMLLAGGVCGAGGALLLATILRRHLMPEYLHNVATLALVLGVYALANYFQHESGLLAVTVMGMLLANMKNVPIDDILDFKESLSVMLISLLFIVLAARIDFASFAAMGWPALGVFAVILFVARPLAVLLSSFGSSLNWRERALLCWIAPRGIVAAAVSALFALRLEDMQFAEAGLLVPLTFMVIIGTVVLQSATARPLANWLKVSEPDPRGALIVGANPVSRLLARALAEKEFRVVLADSHWDEISAARMEGLATYYGNAVSEHADRHLDLVGVGMLFALSRDAAHNALACVRYKREFGAHRVYTLQTAGEKGAAENRAIAPHFVGARLFGEQVTYAMLASLVSQGAEVRSTLLTETFTYASYQDLYGSDVIPLFALDARGFLHVFTVGSELAPAPGWTVMTLLPAPVLERMRAPAAEARGGVLADPQAGAARVAGVASNSKGSA